MCTALIPICTTIHTALCLLSEDFKQSLHIAIACICDQERRMIEYVSLGDYHSAVGFLLASPPEQSARYYRDALCTLALAHAAAAVPEGGQQGSSQAAGRRSNAGDAAPETPVTALPQPPPASSLLWQAAKVCFRFFLATRPKLLCRCGSRRLTHDHRFAVRRWLQPTRRAWAMHCWACRYFAPQVGALM